MKLNRLDDISNEYILLSYDVQSLFINIPIKLAIGLISENQIRGYTSINSRQMYIIGIKLCVENGCFKYKNKYYRQTYGLAMDGCF